MRIIALIDVDSFECQIYQNLYPEWKNKPCVVADRTGRILSVTYEAKKLGVTRNHRVKDLRFVNPLGMEIKIFRKKQKFNKPDSTNCRKVSLEITNIVMAFCNKRNITVERIPIDEWFLDLSAYVDYQMEKHEIHRITSFKGQTVHLESKTSYTKEDLAHKMKWLARNFKEEEKLMIGAGVVNKLIKNIFSETQFSCSAGVSYNKLLAKQACKFRKTKPKRLTIVSSLGVERISKSIPIREIWRLGGELGNDVERSLPNVKTMADLKEISKRKLIHLFGEEDAHFLFKTARGISYDKVRQKIMTNAVNCNSKADLVITNYEVLRSALDDLSKEIIGRLEEEKRHFKRRTKYLKFKFYYCNSNESDDEDSADGSVERTFGYHNQKYSWIAQTCFVEIRKWGFNPNDGTVITGLKLKANNFIRIY